MKSKKTIFWIVTVLLIAGLVFGACQNFNILNKGYAERELTRLGYPAYLLLLLGTAKLASVLTFVITGYSTLKEWAYAGLVILFVGATFSHIMAGDKIGSLLPPFVFLTLVVGSYVLRPTDRK